MNGQAGPRKAKAMVATAAAPLMQEEKDGAKASPIHHRPSHLSADSLQASR